MKIYDTICLRALKLRQKGLV